MGHFLVTMFKTLLTVIVAGAAVIASFYFAYVLIIVLVMSAVAGIAYVFYNRDTIDWFDFDDPDD